MKDRGWLMSLKIWLGLFFCNLLWSLNPTIAKQVIEEIGPYYTAWFKYSVALAAYLGVMGWICFLDFKKKSKITPVFMPMKVNKDLITVACIGAATCFLSPMTQMLGLKNSSAVNNVILVAFEPIFTVVFGWVIFRESLSQWHFLSFFLATIGFLFLSHVFGNGFFIDPSISKTFGYGDCALLVAVAGESLYSVLARDLVKTYSGSVIFGTAVLVGVILLSLAVLPWQGLPPLGRVSWVGVGAIVWLGVMGTAIPYLYWIYALSQSVSIGSVVLSLFLQPLLGAVAAVVFLNEPLGLHQWVGGFMILLAVSIQIMAERSGCRYLEE